MTNLLERIVGMITLEFIVSSIVLAFIINVVAGIFLRRTIETPSIFRYRRIEQLERQLGFVDKLHGSYHQLLCFSFRGIGMAIALFILASGVVTIPLLGLSSYYFIASASSPPSEPTCVKDSPNFFNDPVDSAQSQRRERCAQEMISYSDRMATHYQGFWLGMLRTYQWTLVSTLIGLAIGAASLVYAFGVYRTLYLVANYDEIRKRVENISSDRPEQRK